MTYSDNLIPRILTESDELAHIIISWPFRSIDKVHEHSS